MSAREHWRVGRKVALNVYEGDRPVCQCHSEQDAGRIAAAMNGRAPVPELELQALVDQLVSGFGRWAVVAAALKADAAWRRP